MTRHEDFSILNPMSDTMNFLICGVGGQGTVLASKIISSAALARGEHVMSAETIGMAQRGGSVTSHVRIGSKVYSPLIAPHEADCMISFEAAEAVRNISFLKPNATVIVSKSVVQPVTASLTGKNFSADEMICELKKVTPNVIVVDTENACEKIGSHKVVNMLLLGAACRNKVLDSAEIEKAMCSLVKPEFQALNKKALDFTGEEA